MAVYLTEVVTDLAMPPQQRPIPHQFAMGDNNAYTITALLCDSRNPEAELLDGTVGGELVRPDGVTVALAGEKGDAVRQVNLAAGGLCNATPCSVTLPQACFAVPGRVTLTIKLTEGTTITQALSVSAVVVRTSTDEAVDPGEVIPDLAGLQAAAAEALDAADDARTAASSAVRYDTAQSLTDAQKTTARGNIAAAAQTQISAITDALSFESATYGWEQGTLKQADASSMDSTTRIKLTRPVGTYCGVLSARAATGYEFALYGYNASMVYQGLLCTDGTFKKSGGTAKWSTEYSFAQYGDGSYRFRIVLRNATDPSSNIGVSESVNCLLYSEWTDTGLTESGIAADAKAAGDRLKTLSAAVDKKGSAVTLNAPDGFYGDLNVRKAGNVIIMNQTFGSDKHKLNLTGTNLLDKPVNADTLTYGSFPYFYVDEIEGFTVGHMYRISLTAFGGTYTLDNPAAQFCFLNFADKTGTINPATAYPDGSVFVCTTKPQAVFVGLRSGTYNCSIAIGITDITQESARPDAARNLLQIFDKITTIGDSLMGGYTGTTDPAISTATAKARHANWVSYIGADIGREITNLAVGSSSWKNWRNGTGNTALSDADIDTNCYLVGLGVNDSIQGNAVGTSADIAENKSDNADSVYGNADYVIRTLHEYNADAHIFVFTSPVSRTNSDGINDAIRYIATLYSYVHCIDLDALYRNDFRYGTVSLMIASDATHYEPFGYRIIANYITAAIDSFMLSNHSLFLKVPYEL